MIRMYHTTNNVCSSFRNLLLNAKENTFNASIIQHPTPKMDSYPDNVQISQEHSNQFVKYYSNWIGVICLKCQNMYRICSLKLATCR